MNYIKSAVVSCQSVSIHDACSMTDTFASYSYCSRLMPRPTRNKNLQFVILNLHFICSMVHFLRMQSVCKVGAKSYNYTAIILYRLNMLRYKGKCEIQNAVIFDIMIYFNFTIFKTFVHCGILAIR